MSGIDENTTLEELAALVSRALEDAGIAAILSGGAAVTLYADNEYLSGDLDFVTSAGTEAIGKVLEPLGFQKEAGARQFNHPGTSYYVEFPPGPLAFGETSIRDEDAATLETRFGPVRIVTPTQLVMDRLAAFLHWTDRQSFDQAVMVARHQGVDWAVLSAWAATEGVDASVLASLRRRTELSD